ncbi:MAG: Ig-like domain-containing protein [Saprospiraceae bacterium]|nr:Ig-like domain-containing protein [Saprospiraceae bacterium]
MKVFNIKNINRIFFAGALSIFVMACERDVTDLGTPNYPANPEVFIDGFSGGLNYAAFGGSVPTAFQVDNKETYNSSAASMRFEVPDANDPRGAYAGGTFFTGSGRNLSSFNVLTFWAKASKSATIDIVGFGNDLGVNKSTVSISGLAVNTNWKKYYIPIPDPSKLTAERGMFFYSEGPEEGKGYTFWIDEVRFENLGTIAHTKYYILDGKTETKEAEINEKIQITGLKTSANLPNGVDQTVDASVAYFTFSSSNEEIATVNELGEVTIKSPGEATITAKVGETPASGALTIKPAGSTPGPTSPAPVPGKPAIDVISLYSNAYTNVPVDTWNTRWQFSTAEEFFIKVQNDDVIRYKNLNFVGIEFASNTINATSMTHFHLDIWTPDEVTAAKAFKVLLVDFGPNNSFGGGDDSSHELTFKAPLITSGNWVGIDVPLTAFSGLTRRGNLAQLVLSGDFPNVYIDNVYFYKSGGGGPTAPTTAAPVPIYPATNVISIFSDQYTNVAGINLNPNWGQATKVTEISIQNNKTLKYEGLNYQGIEFGSNQNVSSFQFLHLDFWTANSTELRIFLISPGPVETPFTLTVPTTGWNSIDIPLTAFSPVKLNEVFQIKMEGNGDIYLDNILFRK